MRSSVLRWNRLKRRATALGTDVQTLIGLDAAAQREPSSSFDEEIAPVVTDQAHTKGDTPARIEQPQ